MCNFQANRLKLHNIHIFSSNYLFIFSIILYFLIAILPYRRFLFPNSGEPVSSARVSFFFLPPLSPAI